MIELISVLSIIIMTALLISTISNIRKHSENLFEYSRNEEKAACSMEDYKFVSSLMTR